VLLHAHQVVFALKTALGAEGPLRGSKGDLTVLNATSATPPESDMDDPTSKMRGVANGVPTEATVCFSMLGLTSHASPALFLAADVVVLPLHTRPRHRQHAMTCLQHSP